MSRMSRISEREVARRLSEREEFEPPADLLARLEAEIPADVRLVAPPPEAPPAERRWPGAPPSRRLWLLAASLLAVVGTGLFSLRVMDRMSHEAAEETALPEAAEVAPSAAAGMEPRPAPGSAPEEVDGGTQDGAAAGARQPLSGEAVGGRQDRAREAEPAPPLQAQEVPQALPPPPSTPAPGVLGGRDAAPLLDSSSSAPQRIGPEAPAQTQRQKADLEARRQAAPQAAPLHQERANALEKAGGAAAQAAPRPEAAETFAEEIAVVGEFARPMDTPAIGSSVSVDHATGGPSSEGVNPFVDPEEDRVSTFGLDVDTASYLVARRYLADGRLPPPGSVRVEEFVNFFHYGDPAPERGDFTLAAEGAPTPFGAGERYRLVRFGVRARGAADGAGVPPTVARDARAYVVFDPRAVSRYRLLGYENRDADDRRFRGPNDLGEIGAGHEVSVLYEVKLQPTARPSMPLATVRLRYRPLDGERGERVEEVERSLRLGELAGTWEQASPSLRLAAVVAELAEILRRSYWAREGNLEAVLRQARNLSAESADSPEAERRSELVDLVSRAARLSAGGSAE